MVVLRDSAQCVHGAYGKSAFEELDEIFYIVQPNHFDLSTLLNVNKKKKEG